MAPPRFDVAVVGAGPAGSAAAIALAREGAEVVLIERSAFDGIRIGETLPPETRLLLDRLGVWDRFLDDGHVSSPGILAAWGQPAPYAIDFIRNPYGSGWRVDRNRFDSMLAEEAADAGGLVLTRTAVDRCTTPTGGGWELAVRCGERWSHLRAAFVVDATGRSSSLRRAFGARRVVQDRLIALVSFGPGVPPGAAVDRRAMIEATEEGWWYSAPLPDGRLIQAFHTDAKPGLRARWDGYLAAAPETRARAGDATPREVRVVSAHSYRSDPVAGQAWLGVGDAATAHDPLSGLGIHWALESGIAGAEAILADRNGGRPSATAAYGRRQQARFEQYLATRALYYRAEDRWPDAPFWRRRRHPLPA